MKIWHIIGREVKKVTSKQSVMRWQRSGEHDQVGTTTTKWGVMEALELESVQQNCRGNDGAPYWSDVTDKMDVIVQSGDKPPMLS